jgi:hypothetical protein
VTILGSILCERRLKVTLGETPTSVRSTHVDLAAFNRNAKVREVGREIDALDADRRAAAIESRLEPEVAALR